MGSFYGNIKAGSKVSLVFDKTYPNRKAMEDAINPEKNAASGQINGDGVYNTRYVFIDYGERRYSPYKSVEMQEAWHKKDIEGNEQFTDQCPPLYVYKINGNIQTITLTSAITNDEKNLRYKGEYVLAESYNANYRYYILKRDIFADKYNTLTPDGIDENCEYAINKEIDKANYQDCYDHTVWQKIWCSVTNTSTITEKYIMVASLDAKAPKFESIVDAPNDDDYDEDEKENEYSQANLATITHGDDSSPVKLSPLNVYCRKLAPIQIGEGETATTFTEYEEVDLSIIEEWNNINCNTNEVNDALKKVKNQESELNKNYPNANLVFSPTHNPKLVIGYDEYYNQLENEKLENWQSIQIQFKKDFKTIYQKLYDDWMEARKTAYESAVKAFRGKYGNLYYGLLYQYKAIVSDLDYYAPLVDKDGNQSIYSQNILDGMISSLGNIYYKEEGGYTYTLLQTGATYRSIAENGVKISYYHKELKEAGYISEGLFNRLKGIPQQLYIIKENKYIEVSDEEYNENIKYYQRISSKFNHGPHIDTLHSTDLEYKLHNPRNWKFNVKTDFNYNEAGFRPEKQSYLIGKENKIYLKKTKSGALYPVHMDNKGYKLLNNLVTSGQYSNITTDEKVQLPEAGFYVNNELKYAEQIDQRTFDFNLPEFGNLASKMWDLVYPRGEWIKHNELPKWVDYNDEVYQRGDLYYQDPNNPNRYIQLGKNDKLDRDVQYYIFKPADDDTTDAPRYIFVGNDRAINEDEYPKTMAGLIRYIYKLLGLKTDNDYRDIPSEETIYGIYNGLMELLGKWTDNYEISRFVPVATLYNKEIEPSREVVQYGLSGDFEFGHIWTTNRFEELHNGAFGPLYVAREGFPKWSGEPVNYVLASKFNSDGTREKLEANKLYYIKNNGVYTKASSDAISEWNNETATSPSITAFYIRQTKDELPGGVQYYKKVGDEYVKIDGKESPEIDFYTPTLLYEKATAYSIDIQYYRDMNSLWGLLREFQRCRDGYQSDWTQDIPGSPSHIQHRPGVIYSTEKAATIEYNKDTFYGDNSYSLINTIQDQASLVRAYNALASNECLMVYYLDEKTEAPQYELVFVNSQYIANAKYYKLDKKDYLLEEHNIDGLWTKILINPSDQADYYDNDEQVFNIAYYSSSEILSIFNE